MANLAGLKDADLEGFTTARAEPPKYSKKWKDVSQGRQRVVTRPLCQQQNSRTLWFHLQTARDRWARLKDPAFLASLRAEKKRCRDAGLSRGQDIVKQKAKKAAKRANGVKANAGNKRKQAFTKQAAAALGKAATPAVPMTASGRLNFTEWGRKGGGKNDVGMEINKSTVANEMAAWGHAFLPGEMAKGLYIGKAKLGELVGELKVMTGGPEFERKSGFDNRTRNTSWIDHVATPAAAPPAITPAAGGGSAGGGGSGGSGGGGSGGGGGGGLASPAGAAPSPSAAPPAVTPEAGRGSDHGGGSDGSDDDDDDDDVDHDGVGGGDGGGGCGGDDGGGDSDDADLDGSSSDDDGGGAQGSQCDVARALLEAAPAAIRADTAGGGRRAAAAAGSQGPAKRTRNRR